MSRHPNISVDFADLAALTVVRAREPHWQHLSVGTRVRAVGLSRRLGTVVGIVEMDEITPVTTRVQVRWTNAVRFTEIWPTDCLVIVSEPEESA